MQQLLTLCTPRYRQTMVLARTTCLRSLATTVSSTPTPGSTTPSHVEPITTADPFTEALQQKTQVNLAKMGKLEDAEGDTDQVRYTDSPSPLRFTTTHQNTINSATKERGGPRGPEPTRYGDWERSGRCSDF